MALRFVVLAVVVGLGYAQFQDYDYDYRPAPAPTPILKQINRHNNDGSYTYGYESADGSFKIETKYPNGEVKGKYGFVDDVGKLRTIEYGASKRGFEPAGEGITVAPPTLHGNGQFADYDQYDDGQYRQPTSNFGFTDNFASNSFPQPQQNQFRPAPQVNQYRPSPQFNQYNPSPQFNQYNQSPRFNQYTPVNVPAASFAGHPATNIDLNTGSYQVSYSKK